MAIIRHCDKNETQSRRRHVLCFTVLSFFLAIFLCNPAHAQLPSWTQIDAGHNRILKTPVMAGGTLFAANSVGGRYLFTAYDNETVRIWDFVSGSATAIRFKSDTKLAALVPVDGQNAVLALSQRGDVFVLRASKPYGEKTTGDDESLRKDTDERFNSVAVSPGGQYVVLSTNRSVYVRNASSMQKNILKLSQPFGRITAIAVSDNLSEIILGYEDGNIRIVDFQGERASVVARPITTLRQTVQKLRYDATERRLIALSVGGQLKVFDKAVYRDSDTVGEVSEGRLIASNVRSFDVSRLLNQSDDNRIITIEGAGTVGLYTADGTLKGRHQLPQADDLGPIHPKLALIDYWDTNAIGTYVLFDENSSYARFFEIGDEVSPTTPKAAVLGVGTSGWLALKGNAYFGDSFTLEGITRASRIKDYRSDLDPRVLQLDHKVANCSLLKRFKDFGKAQPNVSRASCRADTDQEASVFTDISLEQKGAALELSFKLDPNIVPTDIRLFHQDRPLQQAIIPTEGCAGCYRVQLSPVTGSNSVYVSVKTASAAFDSPIKTSNYSLASRPIRPKLWVIMIGASDYHNQTDLTSVVSDLHALRDAIVKDNERSGVFDIVPVDRIDKNLSLSSLKDFFAALNTKPDDRVWILLSGHGALFSDAEIGRPGDASEFYFLGPEAPLHLRDALGGDASVDAVSSREIGEWLIHLDARRVLVTIDTCFSGGATANITSALVDRFSVSEKLVPLGVQIFAATTGYASAYDGTTDPHSGRVIPSPATAALLKALDLSDAKDNGLTVESFFFTAQQNLTRSSGSFRRVGSDFYLFGGAGN